MDWTRPFALTLVAALAVEAGIYYLLVGLGAGEDLVIYAELIWLIAATAIWVGVLARHARDH